MPGLAAASENVNKERFLGFRIISRPIGGSNDISYFLDPDYFSGNTFRRNCKVRIIAFAGRLTTTKISTFSLVELANS